jgi:dolichol-phosphate mannosyltransferase
VDDNSDDGSRELFNSLSGKYQKLFILSRNKDFGYGKACIEGFEWSLDRDYKYIITMDGFQ